MKINIETAKKKWKPIYNSLIDLQYKNIDLEILAILCEKTSFLVNRPYGTPFYIDWNTGEKIKDENEIRRQELKYDFLPVMVKIYGLYNMTNYEEVFSYYEKYIDNLPIESLETISSLETIEKTFIRNCLKFIRKDKIEKINSI
jgi:hypothetical protein